MVKNLLANAGDARERCGFDHCVGKIPWRRKWEPTPVFLPRESHGQGSLAGCSPYVLKDSDTTKLTWHTQRETSPHSCIRLDYIWEPLSLSYSYKLMNSLVTQMVKNMPSVWETRV